MKRVLLIISYVGTAYSGMVKQKNARTVAGELQKAIWSIDPEASEITACSRTDAGVHALGQPITFTTHKENINERGWVLALIPLLPPDISIVHAAFVDLYFDPRREAKLKKYSIAPKK